MNLEKVSDNTPLREGKGWSYEGGCRIPFLAMGPGIRPGSVNKQIPVNLIDLFPTFLAMAGQADDGRLDLDGCNLLPVLTGQAATPRFADGAPRDTLYFHYPVLNGAFSTIRSGPWKLLKNTGGPMNSAPEIQLFRLYNDDGSEVDLGEQTNVANKYPEIKQRLLSDLERWLSQHEAGVPYNNAAYKPANLPGQKNVPSITGRGSDGDQIWATFETGDGKSKVVDAFLLYTTNPGKTEEWFRAAAPIEHDRVTATAQPGMTHAVFCLLDENNFLVHSEAIPGMQQLKIGSPVSEVLQDGYVYRPGLVSLIALAKRAQQQAERHDQQTRTLVSAILSAEETVKSPVDAGSYTQAICDLRKAIRSLDIPAARHPALNWFPRSAE